MSLEMLSNILTIAIVFVEIICCTTLFETLFINKKPIKSPILNYLFEVIMGVIFSCLIITSIKNYFLQSICIIALYFLILKLFYNTNVLAGLCVSIITYMLLLAVDSFSALVIFYFLSLPLDMINNNPLHFLLAAIFSKTLFYLIVVLIRRMLRCKSSPELNYISNYHWIVYIFQSTVSLLALLALIETTYLLNRVSVLVALSAFGLLSLNYIVLFLLESSSKRGKMEYENALYRQQIETETNNIKILMKSFESQYQHYHDYKQHLSAIYQLLYDGQYNHAQNCVKSILDDICVSPYYIKTHHPVIDAVLNQKHLQAKSQNIILDIRSEDLSAVLIPDHLLITIISNAIDNALEYTQQLPSPAVVSIKIVTEKNFLIFSVINPVLEKVEVKNNLIPTTKSDKAIHGMGLKNIALALSRCNGDYEIICTDQTFQFTALIQLEYK